MPAYDKLAFFIGSWQKYTAGIILEITLTDFKKLINLNKILKHGTKH